MILSGGTHADVVFRAHLQSNLPLLSLPRYLRCSQSNVCRLKKIYFLRECCDRSSVQSKLGDNSIVAMRKQFCGI